MNTRLAYRLTKELGRLITPQYIQGIRDSFRYSTNPAKRFLADNENVISHFIKTGEYVCVGCEENSPDNHIC